VKHNLFGKIQIKYPLKGIIKPIKKLTGTLHATRARIETSNGVASGYFRPSFFGALGVAGTPVKYQKLVDKNGYFLRDKDGYILLTKEGDETLWQK
jgi:hypothetical protein